MYRRRIGSPLLEDGQCLYIFHHKRPWTQQFHNIQKTSDQLTAGVILLHFPATENPWQGVPPNTRSTPPVLLQLVHMLRQIAADQAYLRMIGRVSIAGIPVQFIGTKDADPRMPKPISIPPAPVKSDTAVISLIVRFSLLYVSGGCSACAL